MIQLHSKVDCGGSLQEYLFYSVTNNFNWVVGDLLF